MELAETSLVPDLRKCAILLDIDGTILDLAPSPQQVWVPTELRQTLTRLDELTGGALALVSGRSLADIDLIFSPLELAAIGGHGAELRATPGGKAGDAAQSRSTPRSSASSPAVTELGPGILAEDKGYSLALHYRLAPEQGRCGARGGREDLRRRAARHGRNPARQARRRDQAGRHQQGQCGVRTDGIRAVCQPQSDLHRRRHHRRAGVRRHFAVRRLGLFGRPGRGRRQRAFRQARNRVRALARAHRGPKQRRSAAAG